MSELSGMAERHVKVILKTKT